MEQFVQGLKTVLLVFISAALAQLMTYGTGVFDLGKGEWKGILAAGVAAAIAFVYNYLSPYDPRYGVGSDV